MPTVRRAVGSVTVTLPADADYTTPQQRQWLHAIVAGELRLQARQLLLPRLSTLAQRHGLSYNRAVVKNMSSRWGSCSTKGNINLSLWLLLAPEPLVDYVLLHELAHLREMNHGPQFWALLDTMTHGHARQLRHEMNRFARTLVATAH